MIHILKNVPKIMDYENSIYFIASSQKLYLLGLFKDKHLK
jgi:hypothetical protein